MKKLHRAAEEDNELRATMECRRSRRFSQSLPLNFSDMEKARVGGLPSIDEDLGSLEVVAPAVDSSSSEEGELPEEVGDMVKLMEAPPGTGEVSGSATQRCPVQAILLPSVRIEAGDDLALRDDAVPANSAAGGLGNFQVGVSGDDRVFVEGVLHPVPSGRYGQCWGCFVGGRWWVGERGRGGHVGDQGGIEAAACLWAAAAAPSEPLSVRVEEDCGRGGGGDAPRVSAPSQPLPIVSSSPQVGTGSVPVQSPSEPGDQGWQVQQHRRGRPNLRSRQGEQEGGLERDDSGARV
ncbi:hypothetical protein Dimus_036700 [Dionaea muscipula]